MGAGRGHMAEEYFDDELKTEIEDRVNKIARLPW